jgi:L-rhamnonate dehydratase
MSRPTVANVRAYVPAGSGGADYHDQPPGHWIDDHIASPMAKYPAYRSSRQSFGLNLLGTVVVEVEASDGTVGFAPTIGGEPAAWIIERHLARLIEGAPVTDLERIWDQMFLSTLHYGRKGLAVNAISGVDLALWDLLGKLRQEPVHALLGGPVRDEIVFYATGPRPDIAHELGFIGAKVPLHHGPGEGSSGFRRNVETMAAARASVGPDFLLMLDCWMSLDLDYATRLTHALEGQGLRWLEEPFLPDDYWAHAALRRRMPPSVMLSAGEHEATRHGFRLLLELGAVDLVQPDVGWCGGLTELLKISALADAHGAMVIPHGSSVYSYHFVATRHNSPFAEFLMMHPEGTQVVPMFDPLLLDEPVPRAGRLAVSALDGAGFGVRLNPDQVLTRPYTH